MTPGRTLRLFAAYLATLGVALLLAPGPVFALMMLPPPPGDQVFFIGLLVAALAVYYHQMSRSTAFAQTTVLVRPGFVFATLAGAAAGWVAPNYLLAVWPDLLGAWATARALRHAGHPAISLA